MTGPPGRVPAARVGIADGQGDGELGTIEPVIAWPHKSNCKCADELRLARVCLSAAELVEWTGSQALKEVAA
jgi:hypothetical protein